MSARRKTPKIGDIVVVNRNGKEDVFMFCGLTMINAQGELSTISDKDIDYAKTWEDDKTWRFANSEEKAAFESNFSDKEFVIKDVFERERMVYEKPEPTVEWVDPKIDAYKAELVRLYELLDDIDFMAQLGKFIDDEALLTMIRTKCNRRKRIIKNKGRDLIFNGDYLTHNNEENE